VRAEAGRAKADGKLIPVKTPELTYADVPLPFGEMHTENIGSTDLIRAAIVAQLAKPAVIQSPFWQITGVFKYQVLTWIGILGSVISLFVAASVIIDLADRVRELVHHWQAWNQIIWEWVFSWTKVKARADFVPVLTFIAFATLLVAGVNLSVRSADKEFGGGNTPTLMTKIGILVVGVLSYLAIAFIALLVPLAGLWLADKWIEPRVDDLSEALVMSVGVLLLGLLVIAAVVVPIGFPIIYLMYNVKERAWALISSVLFLFMAVCLGIAPLFNIDRSSEGTQESVPQNISEYVGVWGFEIRRYGGVALVLLWFVLLQVIWMAVILFSSLRQLTRRLVFVVLGVLALVFLNEISKLNLRQYLQPTKVSEISSPTHNLPSQAAA
jgi:hypothetical protein